MSDAIDSKNNNSKELDSDSSQLSDFDENVKNVDIISSSSDDENMKDNDTKEKEPKIKDKDFDKQENSKLLGNKRTSSKEHVKDDSNKNYKKYNKYNNYTSDQNKIFQPSLDIPLVSYDLFCELYKEKEKEFNSKNASEEELKKLYEEYKSNHEKKNNEEFFVHHYKDQWFLEKYSPEDYDLFNYKERNEMYKRKAKLFFEKYQKDKMISNKEMIDIDDEKNLIKSLNYIFDLKRENEFNKNFRIIYTRVDTVNNRLEEKERDFNNIPITQGIIQKEIEEDGRPYYFYDSNYLTLYSLPKLQKNFDLMPLMDVLNKQKGFVSISLSEPERMKDYKREFWLLFDNEENYKKALDNLNKQEPIDHFEFKLKKSETEISPYYRTIKLTPPLFDERLNEDLISSYKIINIFDEYRLVQNNPLTQNFEVDKIAIIDNEEKIKMLNMNILYLRKVYGFCYYCLKGYKDERLLSKRCDFLHLRHYVQLGKRENVENIDINKLNITEDELNNAKEFDKFFNKKLSDLLNDKEKINEYILLRPKYLMNDKLALDKLNEAETKFFKLNTKTIDKEVYECKICRKKFRAFNFVGNHIKNRHDKELEEYSKGKVNKYLTKENFRADKDKFSRSSIINSKEKYEEYNSNKYHNNISTYDNYYHKYKDWDDPINFQTNKTQYKKICYDDL